MCRYGTVVCIVAVLFSHFQLSARDVTERDVESKNSWHEEFDISQKKSGKYNIMVTVEDSGGNQTIGGPYNIFIDPDSDLPVTGITNPAPSMRVRGNLNIVGTCVDDDAVDFVTLILDGDKENPVRAQGNTFWSYYLDTSGLEEGKHTIEAYGTDINGVVGKSVTTVWHLDRYNPDTTVTNRAMGTLVSGLVTLRGICSDGNGIAELSYSMDGGLSFIPLKLERSKQDQTCYFSFMLNTRNFKDGTTVIWFKARDRLGSESIYTYMCFVDNSAPELEIVWPQADQPQNGIFSAAGFVRDIVGISKLSWQFGGERGELELIPGNPYWHKEFDTRSMKASAATLVLTAEDSAGNKSTLTKQIKLDQNLDKPTVRIASPAADEAVEGLGTAVLRGIASDDDGVTQVCWRLDGDDWQTVDTNGVFCAVLNEQEPLAAGSHTVSVYAVDRYGVRGDTVSASFMAKGPEPEFGAASIKEGGTVTQAVYGRQVNPRQRPSYETSVHADCGIAWVRYRFTGAAGTDEQSKEYNGQKTVNISLPLSSLPAGAFTVEVTAADIYGRTVQQQTVLGIQSWTKEGGAVPVSVPPEPPAPPAGDTKPPVLRLAEPADRAWIHKVVRLQGTAVDDKEIAAVEYSVDGGRSWTVCRIKDGVFSAAVPVSVEDGLVALDVRAVDTAGNESFVHRALHKDTTPPQVQVVLPQSNDTVNGEVFTAFAVSDNGFLSGAAYNGELEIRPLITTLVGTRERPLNDAMAFSFTDAAGNTTTVQSWEFYIDKASDLPKVEIFLPMQEEVITTDFKLTGVVYDDDGPACVYYRIDEGPWTQLGGYDNSFTVDIPLSALSDNEHEVSVYAVDINGTKGEVESRTIRVSLEEPKASLTLPRFDASVQGIVELRGKASDKNGIEKVQVSLDNGISYNDCTGTDDWTYVFDSRILADGSHSLFIKVFDSYGIEALYSSLVNTDNTVPELSLDLPMDGSRSSGMLFFVGYALDNMNIEKLYVSIHGLDRDRPADGKYAMINFPPERIISKAVDISDLSDGYYNIEMTCTDAAGNDVHVSRNIILDKSIPVAKADLLYPLNGQHVQGKFNLYGTISSNSNISTVLLLVDDQNMGETAVSSAGYFEFTLTPDLLPAGEHRYKVRALVTGTSVTIESHEQTFHYSPSGPWVTIDNFTYGDFAVDRPYLIGSAGYALSEDDVYTLRSKEATYAEKAAVQAKNVRKVELSFDNGRTFTKVSDTGKWRYRIENNYLPEGYQFLLVRATMKNGETAVTRTIVQIDKTKPFLRLISPGEGGHFNKSIEFSGLANDVTGLQRVTLALRKGDRSLYQVPSFIQGLYLDWHFWGATLYDIGAGLTFFDDNVKLQFQWGQFTQEQRNMFRKKNMRYGGDNVMGIKILANVGYLPFQSLLGPDWEWLSSTLSIGANFTRFNETNSGTEQILSALIAQWEFPRVTLPKVKRFRVLSLYTEFQLWFVPSDIRSSGSYNVDNLVPLVSAGVRVNVF